MSKFISTLFLAVAMLFGNANAATKVPHATLDLTMNKNVVLIRGPVKKKMSENIVRKIGELSAATNAPIYYVIDTNGGSLMAGNEIIRAMHSAKNKSICVVSRAAFSMGALILSNCDESYIHADASILFHEGYLGVEARMSEVFTYIEFEKKNFDALNKKSAAALKMPLDKFIAKQKDEWWITADEAVQIGLCKAVLDKFSYTLPPEEKQDFFSMIFGGDDNEGFMDMTYYPKNEQNPYDPAMKTGIQKNTDDNVSGNKTNVK